jgi:hypothetical protein
MQCLACWSSHIKHTDLPNYSHHNSMMKISTLMSKHSMPQAAYEEECTCKSKNLWKVCALFFYFIMLTILHMVCKPWMVLVMKLWSQAVSCSSKQAGMNAHSCNFAADISWKLDSITFIWADEGDGRQEYHTINKSLRKSYEDKIDCFL